MSEHDNDDLNDLDLHAWPPPPPPKGLADAVIARATATDEAIAVTKRGQQRRTLVTAAIACSGSIAAAVAVWLVARPAPVQPIEMTVIAAQPQHVAFGDSTVDLTAGATIQTERRGDTLHVVQSGTATWHVGANDHLEIDAGSNGAIEATGASLRVESTMTTQNALLVGGGVLSAAAIALVTATVYEGHVEQKADEHGVVRYNGPVKPGGFITIGDEAVVAEKLHRQVVEVNLGAHAPEPVAVKGHADIAIKPGVSATIWAAESGRVDPPTVGVEFQSACQLRVEIDGKRGVPVSVANSDNGIIDMDLAVGDYTYDAACFGQAQVHGTLDIREDTCRRAACGVEAERMLTITSPELGTTFGPPSVHVTGTTIDPESITLSVGADIINPAPSGVFAIDFEITTDQSIALRIDHPRLGTQFFVQRSIPGGAATVKKAPACSEMKCQSDGYADACCSTFTKPDPKTCKADELVRAGTSAWATGDNAAAMRDFAAAYACKPEPHTLDECFMAACNASDVPAARIWWRKLSADAQNEYVIMCNRRNITRAALDAP